MRIAIDVQGIQSEGSSKRGIGRYSIEIVRNLILNDKNNQYILVANGALSDIQSTFSNELENSNVRYFTWYSPLPINFCSKNKINLKIGKLLRSYAFNCLHVDIILISSFFEGFSDNCLLEFDMRFMKVPLVSIFYDLIPLLNPDLYLNNNPEFSKFYKTKINNLSDLHSLLAISDSSGREIVDYLDIPKEKVYVISSACNQNIFNRSICPVSHENTIDIESPYLLYSGAGDPRKNLKGLIEAYSYLPNNLIKYKLVLAGKLLTPEIQQIDNWINKFKIKPSQVITTGYVTDQQLALLYKNCALFVFPSFHEGFGLPILEAMNCGAPVIGSNCTSIPEVINLKQALFDPSKPIEISKLIEKALTDNNFMRILKENSLVQSKKFSWEKCARSSLDAFNAIHFDSLKTTDKTDWFILNKNNNIYLKDVLNNLKSDFSIHRYLRDELLEQTCASIDKITLQSKKYIKSITQNEKIKTWKVEGPFDSSYSLAILNRHFTESLSNKIKSTFLHITEGNGDYPPNINYLKKFSTIFNIFNSSEKSDIQPDVLSRNMYPPRVSDMNGKYNIVHSYGWEESEFPQLWVDEFNHYLDGITVMSKQVKKILIDNGVRIPIKVTGLGLDHIGFSDILDDFTINAKTYRFLHVSSCFPRKGIDTLLQAYQKSFSSNDDVSLVIKTFVNPHNNISEILKRYKDSDPLFPDVVVLFDDLSEQQIKRLYSQSDALIAPSRGEGFGLPIGEAMLQKLPVITTSWGGQTDFCNTKNSWLVDFKFVKANSHFNLEYSYWAEPCVDELAAKMYEVYTLDSDAIAKKTLSAVEEVKKLKWDVVVDKNISFIKDNLYLKNTKKTKIGMVSTWFSKCGIASYAKHLVDCYSEPVNIFVPLNEEFDESKHTNIFPSWELNKPKEKMNLLISKILSSNITSLIIQFNYGFFDFDQFFSFLNEIRSKEINIFIIFHSTIDPDDTTKQLNTLAPILKHCSRLVVHTIDDLNRLKSLGLVDNVCILPHGIVDYDVHSFEINKYNIINKFVKTRSIASFGYCLPNKGFDQLIEALAILRKRNFSVHLNMYTAIYGDSYNFYSEHLMTLVKELNLDDLINIDFEYKTESEIFKLLSKNNLIVYPYQQSTESSSASVRDGLATLKPVLVTPSEIFKDLDDLVYYCDGFTANDIANGIQHFFKHDHKYNLDAQKNKLFTRKFPVISKRLFSMIKSLEIN